MLKKYLGLLKTLPSFQRWKLSEGPTSVSAACPALSSRPSELLSTKSFRRQSSAWFSLGRRVKWVFSAIFTARVWQGRSPACLSDPRFGFVVLAINLKEKKIKNHPVNCAHIIISHGFPDHYETPPGQPPTIKLQSGITLEKWGRAGEQRTAEQHRGLVAGPALTWGSSASLCGHHHQFCHWAVSDRPP